MDKIGTLLPFAPPPGLLNEAQAKARDQKRALEAGRESRLANIQRSGIGKHLGPGDTDRVCLERVNPTDALRLIQSWAEKDTPRRWMMLSGTVGIGKTVAAAWLLARDGGRYVTMTDLVRMFAPILRGLAPQTQDDALARLDALAGARTLVLDELGRDGLSPEVAREALHWLVEARQGAKRGRTLVLSNLSASEIRSRFKDGTYDPRTSSRLSLLLARDKGGGAVFELAGKDLRGAPL